MTEIFVAATGCVPVAKHDLGTGRTLAAEAARAALHDVGADFTVVESVFAGVALPSSPWAVHVAKEIGLTGVPVFQNFGASASGLAAVHQALMSLRAGACSVALVIGYDVPANSEDPLAAQGFLPPPALFAMWARRRILDTATTPEHMALVAAKNWNYARANPNAVRRAETPVTADDVLASKMVAEPLTAMMCTPWVFGAAAIVLATRDGLARLPGVRWPMSRIDASEVQSEKYTGPAHQIEGAVVGPPEISRSTFAAALAQSGHGVDDVDIVQTHDGFAIEELVYYELFGFAQPGETERLVEQGAFGPHSRRNFGLPEFSTDGGLIGRGHPAGPSGIFQHIENLRRFREHGDKVGVCHLLGAGSTCITQVVTRIDQ